MTKVTDEELAKYKGMPNSRKKEEMRIIVPIEVANEFRRVAKEYRLPPAELFAEMVAAFGGK